MFNLDIEFGIVVAPDLKKQMKNNQNLCQKIYILMHSIQMKQELCLKMKIILKIMNMKVSTIH